MAFDTGILLFNTKVMTATFEKIADRCIAGTPATAAEALDILRSSDAQLLDLVAATGRVRRHFFSNLVKVNYLVNLKSGLCPEDCGYCSQRLGSDTDILTYSWLAKDEAHRQAQFGLAGGASRVCLVASGRGPSNREVKRVADMAMSIKETNPQAEVCACLGFLKDGQADTLRDAGVDAYNHNINTAASHYENICSTHTYDDRVDTVNRARTSGLSPCSGMIVGMGETPEQIVEAIEALQELQSDSIPVNFLIPFEGTPLEGKVELTPTQCIRILCAVRLMCPDKELRIAGGRELHLKSLQPMSLHIANSLFLGDYLTSEGQAAEADLDMIVDGGFGIVGCDDAAALRDEVRAHRAAFAQAQATDEHTGSAGCGHGDESAATRKPETSAPAATLPCGKPRPQGTESGVTMTTIRRRGAGTSLAPNA